MNMTVETDGKKEDVLVELTKENLDALLESLSNANEVCIIQKKRKRHEKLIIYLFS